MTTKIEATPVKVVKSKGGNSLVEWVEGADIYRSWLPNKEVADGHTKNPEKGLSYGDDFTPLLKHLPTAAVIIQSLHNRGLWTKEDVEANPQLAWDAVAVVYGPVINMLISGELDKEKDK
mgnify:CR=1 FL=1